MIVSTGAAATINLDAERLAAPMWHDVVFTDGVTGVLRYCKVGSLVQVTGRVVLPSPMVTLSPSSAAWLPAGYRPKRDSIRFPINENFGAALMGHGNMFINAAGIVYLQTSKASTNGYWVHVTYFAEQ